MRDFIGKTINMDFVRFEKVKHVFVQCEFVHEFWLSFQSWIQF